MSHQDRIEGDWYDGRIPHNTKIDPKAYIESSYSFHCFASTREIGLRLGAGVGLYRQTVFDAGPDAYIEVGPYSMINSARLVCDAQITIGSHCLIAWNVVLMDSRRAPYDCESRRGLLSQAIEDGFHWPAAPVPAEPITLADNVWIGFDCVVLPGVTIGEGSVVGARSVVYDDIPPYSIAVGNPARVVRTLEQCERNHVD